MVLMNRVYKPYLDKFVIVFIDDISIAKANKEYEEHLRLILGLLKNKELYIHEAQVESLKIEKVKDENLHGMDKELRLVLIELPALGVGVGYHAGCTNGPNIEAGIATRNSPLEMGKHSHGFYHKTTKNNRQLRHDLGNRDHQEKNYADVRRKPLEFQIGDKAMLKSLHEEIHEVDHHEKLMFLVILQNLEKWFRECSCSCVDGILVDGASWSMEVDTSAKTTALGAATS
ncbi:hypothetical protein Tco_1418986 [Tanacetum coccineum]